MIDRLTVNIDSTLTYDFYVANFNMKLQGITLGRKIPYSTHYMRRIDLYDYVTFNSDDYRVYFSMSPFR